MTDDGAAYCEVCGWDGDSDAGYVDPLVVEHERPSGFACHGPEVVRLRARVKELEAELAAVEVLAKESEAVPLWRARMEAAGFVREDEGGGQWYHDAYLFVAREPNGLWRALGVGDYPDQEAACLACLASIGAP